MYKIKYSFSSFLGLMIAIAACRTAQGQYIIKQADSEASLYNYAKAIPLYEKAYHKKNSLTAARGLADSYRLLNDYDHAASWYEKLLSMPDHTENDEIHYAGTLINQSKYAEAKTLLQNYLTRQPDNKTAVSMLRGCDSAVTWLATPVKGDFENMKALNSPWSDWSTAFSNDRIIFASDRPYDSLRRTPAFNTSNIRKKYYGWTGNSYLHLYENNGTDSNSTRLLGRNINGDYHSANASYTADGQKLYYAVTELKRKRNSLLGKDEPYTLHIEIMERQRDTAGNWKPNTSFPYNGIFSYPVGDPFITPDGQTLYFVAEYKDQGYGGTDIYYSRKDNEGKWQSPVNMGPDINTAGDERTPLVDKKGALYFASAGHPGMGGLDIFKAEEKNGQWTARNMGSPVNSAGDDLAPAVINTTLYFSSNRPGGKGSDDIYRFTPYRVLIFNLTGVILDKKTGKALPDAEVTLYNEGTGIQQKAVTDAQGNYSFPLDSISSYGLSVAKTGYNPATGFSLTTKGLSESAALRQDAYLTSPEPEPAKTPAPVPPTRKTFKLENVYFDLAKWNITPASMPELDKLVSLLKENPDWKVELATHTDCRASDSYNLKLSQRRAESIVGYLISKGIAASRLVAKGYGETRLLNRCADGVRCTEAEHQVNRRTEFTILDK
ncbi:OmpA family protein [Chitinophaga tropicalis]|uniref:OmpA family protein n=1 Tax=Chitinophaga tropicalis TaxID=2683588 RepID=A0A7K1U407_9BACT|nr:OmpA family protein [Chitinophaga tropicalis]MVT09094.1 OmpA family protein [Chitinophaga tropicalis]